MKFNFTEIPFLKEKANLRQVFLVMKITAIFLLAACLQVNADAEAQSITYSKRNATLKEVFRAIRNQTGYEFLYNDPMIQKARKMDLKFDHTQLTTVLEEVFKNQPLAYMIIGETIVVKEQLKPQEIVSVLQPEYLQVEGIVVDSATRNPLVGVTIQVKGTTIGANTDHNGKFKLAVQEDAVLVVSYLGYDKKEIEVNGRTFINITLVGSATGLDQVVVVGYGTQKKSSVTAAIATLEGEEIASTPISNLSNSIGGRVSGVIVRQNNGEPGNDGSDIYIRGISSTGATHPLLIVDGIPRDFTQLDPNTIESFTVLKDAAAVAPYGVAGANGVILVTTKRGKTGAPTLTYNGYIGFQNPTILPDYVSGYQFALLQNAASKNEGLPIPYSDLALQKLKDGSEPDVFPDPNVYENLLNKNALLTNHNIELSGGTDRVKYYTSLSYQYQAGMWPTTNNKKYNLNINLDAQATKTTKISFGVNGRVQNASYPSIAPGRLFELIGYTDTRNGPLYFSNGLPGTYITASITNSGYHKINTLALYSQLSIEQEIPFIPGLEAKGTIAYDPTVVLDKLWRMPVHKATIDTTQDPYVINDGIFEQTKSSLIENINQSHQITYQASLSYAHSFGRNHLSALTLFEAKANDGLSLGASRRNYNLTIDEINMGSSSQADMSTVGTSNAASQIGLVYRVTYDYADKYLFEASGRYDGSYYFAPNHRFGFFPAFSIGWRLSEENFIKKINWIDNLKIRGSYGEVGALAGSAFQYLSTYSVAGPVYVLASDAVQGAAERAENNPDITWERSKEYDVGVDASFWKGLLSIEADYFHDKRSNMLLAPDVIIPQEYGIGLSQVNAGVMKNQGIDLSIGSNYNIAEDIQVSLTGNLTYAKNTLLQVFETAATYDNPNRRKTGKSLGTLFGYHALGYFQSEDFEQDGTLKKGIATQPWGAVQPGDIRYEDMDGDGQIDNDDLTNIGSSSVPQIIYGISPSVRYKDFSLNLFFQGSAKADIYMDRQNKWAFYNGMSAFVDNFNYWTPENPNAKYPRITTAPTTNNTQTSSFWVQNASYLRLKSITIAYTIPPSVTSKIGIQNIRVYASGQNVFTWSRMLNFDPESTGPYTNLYPQQKVISVGLNVTL